MTYEWKNVETGEVVETNDPSNPPRYGGPNGNFLPGTWVRVFKFGVGKVQGGGGSPARGSV